MNLISFTGKAATEGNQLHWKVAANSTAVNYKVEKSTNGRNWLILAEIPYEPDKFTYQSTDLQFEEICYYRLNINEKLHDRFISSIIALDRATERRITICPTVTHQYVEVKGREGLDLTGGKISVIDQLAKVVLSRVSDTQNGGKEKLDLGNSQPGLYHIRVSHGLFGVVASPIIKQ